MTRDPLVLPLLPASYPNIEKSRKITLDRFIYAVNGMDLPRYYLPEELTPSMFGRKIRIIGGYLDGYEGYLLTTRGSRVKRLLVDLPNWITAAVEVNPEFIQLL